MHIMLDLETWGTRPGSALRSIGAVEFHPNDKTVGPTFYRNIDKESCSLAGLTVDAETVAWWAKQTPESVAALENDQQPLNKVVSEFNDWVRGRPDGPRYVWSHGANFDEPLWSAACRAVMAPVPWKYWDVRCTRTLFALRNLDMRKIPREGVAHNALDDAVHQAKCVQLAFAKSLAE